MFIGCLQALIQTKAQFRRRFFVAFVSSQIQLINYIHDKSMINAMSKSNCQMFVKLDSSL